MKIIEENGKRVLVTSVLKKGNSIDASKLFNDLKEVVKLDSDNGVAIDGHHPAQKIINRFSGEYMSPTMLKGFFDSPATQVHQSLMPWIPSAATAIGTTVHSIFEEFYSLDKDKRDTDILYDLLEKYIEENDQEDERKEIKHYIDGFIQTPDYLDQSKEMDHKNLDCYNEVFMKGEVAPLGIHLPLPIYSLSDRIDFREVDGELGAYIIDYKTGKWIAKDTPTMNGYLPQAICYKWMVEDKYGVPVKGAYLLTPGAKQKIVQLDVNSLKNQSMYIEEIFRFKKEIQESAKTRIYPWKKPRYLGSERQKEFNKLFMTNAPDQEIKIEYDITLSK